MSETGEPASEKMAAPSDTCVANEQKEKFILKLHEIGGVKFGDFKLKSGVQSPVYLDLRVIVSYPELMKVVANYLWEAASKVSENFTTVCGVPYTALPIATVMSVENNVPMLIRRREAKDYGTRKMIEGHFKVGENCLVVEDVTTSGSSVLETVAMLKEVGLQVKDAAVLLEREQGADYRLKQEGITLHSVLTMTQLIQTLHKHQRVDTDLMNRVMTFIKDNRFDQIAVNGSGEGTKPEKNRHKTLCFSERASICSHPLTKQLFSITAAKQTNLVVSVDLTKADDIINLVDKVGPHVCVVKTHVDIITDFSPEFAKSLSVLAEKHQFLIFEDRKFADIGNTVLHQYRDGMYHIADWAHITNAHPVSGPGVIQGLKEVGLDRQRGCLLVAQMSSAGNLATGTYTKEAVKMAEENKDFVMGFISQSQLSTDPQFIHMTPGVKLQSGLDSLGQQYVTPHDAVFTNKSDFIIVGRGITMASDPVQAAILYKEAGFQAYQQRIS